jgi:DNA-binding transcriptional regulator YbjK
MSPAAPGSDRRLRIADASLEIIASQGARHLSHRAVDAALSLPTGSTSYYFSTRAALLEAAVARLVEADTADVAGLLVHDPSARAPGGVLAFAQAVFALWTARSARTRLAARLELLLDAARVGPHHPLLVARREFLQRTERAFAEAGSADAALEALRLVACIDGLLLHELVGSRLSGASSADVIGSLDSARKGSAGRAHGAPTSAPEPRAAEHAERREHPGRRR